VCRVAGGLRGFFMPRSIILQKDEKYFAKNLTSAQNGVSLYGNQKQTFNHL
jgi:hypothetical protein